MQRDADALKALRRPNSGPPTRDTPRDRASNATEPSLSFRTTASATAPAAAAGAGLDKRARNGLLRNTAFFTGSDRAARVAADDYFRATAEAARRGGVSSSSADHSSNNRGNKSSAQTAPATTTAAAAAASSATDTRHLTPAAQACFPRTAAAMRASETSLRQSESALAHSRVSFHHRRPPADSSARTTGASIPATTAMRATQPASTERTTTAGSATAAHHARASSSLLLRGSEARGSAEWHNGTAHADASVRRLEEMVARLQVKALLSSTLLAIALTGFLLKFVTQLHGSFCNPVPFVFRCLAWGRWRTARRTR